MSDARTCVTLAPMRKRHLPAVLEIEAKVYPKPWSSRLFEEELERSRRAYLVARVGEQVVGYAGLLMIAEDGHVATVAVDPAWQGRGVARAMLGRLIRSALDLGADQLTLEVRVTNLTAQHLYQSFGFAPAGARKAYYADNGEDALVMWAHDIRGRTFQERLAQAEVPPGLHVELQGFDAAPVPAVVHPAARPTVEAS